MSQIDPSSPSSPRSIWASTPSNPQRRQPGLPRQRRCGASGRVGSGLQGGRRTRRIEPESHGSGDRQGLIGNRHEPRGGKRWLQSPDSAFITSSSTTPKEQTMTTTNLTPAQHAIPARPSTPAAAKIDWFPDNIKGGARKKVLDGMFNRAPITPDGEGWWRRRRGRRRLGTNAPTTRSRRRSRCRTERPLPPPKRRGRKRRQNQAAHARQQQIGRSDPDAATPEGATISQISHRHRLAGTHGAAAPLPEPSSKVGPDHRFGQATRAASGSTASLDQKSEKGQPRLASIEQRVTTGCRNDQPARSPR